MGLCQIIKLSANAPLGVFPHPILQVVDRQYLDVDIQFRVKVQNAQCQSRRLPVHESKRDYEDDSILLKNTIFSSSHLWGTKPCECIVGADSESQNSHFSIDVPSLSGWICALWGKIHRVSGQMSQVPHSFRLAVVAFHPAAPTGPRPFWPFPGQVLASHLEPHSQWLLGQGKRSHRQYARQLIRILLGRSIKEKFPTTNATNEPSLGPLVKYNWLLSKNSSNSCGS